MKLLRTLILAALVLIATTSLAQDLAPRAYVITPYRSNALLITYSYFSGDILFEGAVPITDATGDYNVPILSYYHSFSFFGRSANFTASLPYAFGTFEGNILGEPATIHRSGLADSVYRLSVNLKGGPNMSATEFRRWRQKTIIGASIKIVAPTGQYDKTKLINWGSNRWAFKPEIGLSRRWGKWIVDGYGGVWLFTANPHFFENPQFTAGTQERTQNPIGVFEGHLSYDFKPRLWVSLDGNYWWGGTGSINGVENPVTRQSSSRLGVTASIPMDRHQSVKVSYSGGAYARFGGNYKNLSVAWQYSWIGKQVR